MIKIFIFITAIVLLASCSNVDSQRKNLTYQNIVILSDLSSRMKNKTPHDLEKIHKIIQFFKNECVKPGEKIGDRSSISFSAFSERVICSIDIDAIKNLGDKQQFINSTGKFQNSGLDYQLSLFEQKVRHTYASKEDSGLDLISILVDKIEHEPIVKQNTFLTDGIDTTFICFENHIYIFTDGYLEYKNKAKNNQFYFGKDEIEEIRKYMKRYNADISKALEMNTSLRLPVHKSNKNQFVHLHILETHERDKNDVTMTYDHKAGERDNEILEAVWRTWANESGFKSFKWEKY